ncbi:hypothetical protein [Roseiconus lacunae]|uniref:hypothetical protein n=1 Tax=Roseiconus lacunae TaxID=2605694 RepID=UPI001E2923B7|nr:hypothetical protein [Roseiconus lacunae]
MKIVYLKNGESSPMVKHHPLEIAACDESQTFYVFEVFARTYGTTAVEKGCRKYSREHWGQQS